MGEILGVTNGCFDGLHLGHILMLKAARQQCDRLIVLLNSDESVKRLKGKDRPLFDVLSRIESLRENPDVDEVIVFGDSSPLDDPLPWIKQLKPDKLFKGDDYTYDTIRGADFVTENGGEVVIIPTRLDDYASSLLHM